MDYRVFLIPDLFKVESTFVQDLVHQVPNSAQLRSLLKLCILKVKHVVHWFVQFIYHF